MTITCIKWWSESPWNSLVLVNFFWGKDGIGWSQKDGPIWGYALTWRCQIECGKWKINPKSGPTFKGPPLNWPLSANPRQTSQPLSGQKGIYDKMLIPTALQCVKCWDWWLSHVFLRINWRSIVKAYTSETHLGNLMNPTHPPKRKSFDTIILPSK